MVNSMEKPDTKPQRPRKRQKITPRPDFPVKQGGIDLGVGVSDCLGIWHPGYGISEAAAIDHSTSKIKKVVKMDLDKFNAGSICVSDPGRRKPLPPWSVPEKRGWGE